MKNQSMPNQVHKLPGQEQMQVEVILASVPADRPNDKPLVTMRLRYPRIIHGEVLTHRLFSRNARSSRAVPVKTMLLECTSIPFVPWHWGKNQKGMQADTKCDETVWVQDAVMPMAGYAYGHPEDWKGHTIEKTGVSREDAWLIAAQRAAQCARAFMEAGYHKQIPNRLLEPFSWIDVLITSNQWDNFLWLRDHKDAEPHLQDLARLVKTALDEMHVQTLKSGEWHLPYITVDDRNAAMDRYPDSDQTVMGWNWLCKISAARCARISYKPFDGDASYERELERYDMLVTSERVHASPTEHQAKPDVFDEVYEDWCEPSLHGNLPGYIQARKLIPNESHNG